MSNEPNAAPPPAAVPGTSEGVEKQSGNLSVSQATLQLLQRGAPESPAKPSAEQATPPVFPPAETAPAPAPVEGQPPPDSSAEEVPPETPPTETPDDAKDGKALSHELSPELQAKIDKRVGKEVAKRKIIEEENTRLKVQLAQASQPATTPQQQAPTPDEPLGHVHDLGTLTQEYQNIKEVKRWAQGQLLRDDLEVGGVEAFGRTWSKSELHNTVLNADRVLEDQIPARHNFLLARAKAEQTARETFAWMNEPDSPEMADYKAAFSQYPFLAKLPDAPMVVAVQLAGQKYLKAQREAAEAAKAKKSPPKPNSPPPGSQTAIGGATGTTRESAQATAQKQVESEVQNAKVKGNLTQKDLAKLLSQKAQSTR